MKMGLTNLFRVQTPSLPNYLLSYAFYALLPIAFLSLYFLPIPFITSHIKLPFSSPIGAPPSSEMENAYKNPCDYSNGKWVRDRSGPLYNGTTNCKMKKTQNCFSNGRPDTEFLYWRWKPNQCNLPRFEPHAFVQLVKNKHVAYVAFVGDSVARNQVESLICMLGTASSKPKRVYHQGSRRWHILSHNANLSFYWSPFLVQGVMRSEKGPHCNTIHIDRVNERWARDMDEMDLIVLSLGHWFDVPSIYYEGGSVLGCLNCPEFNCTNNIEFYGPLRKALRIALNSIIERKAAKGDGIDVIVRTYSPSHFEGDWDKGGTCSKDKPYREGEKQLEGMDAEIRKIELEEVEIAKEKAKQFGGFRLEAMDVTKLALFRPDGHPGAYMKPFPFANGVSKHVQNDCVHWCLPGPIDTWNEIFLEMMKKLVEQPRNSKQ